MRTIKHMSLKELEVGLGYQFSIVLDNPNRVYSVRFSTEKDALEAAATFRALSEAIKVENEIN
jgi:hypothetical protein